MKHKISIIGDINIDLITTPVSKYPEKDKSVLTTFIRKVGGEAANSAFALKALGMDVSFFGSIGRDIEGEFISNELLRMKIPSLLSIDNKNPTGITMAITFKDGSRSMITEEGSNARYNFTDYNLLAGSDHVMIGGLWHCDSLNLKKIFSKVKRNGVSTSLNIGWDLKGWSKKRRDKILKNLDLIDILFLNSDEITALTQKKTVKDALNYLRMETEVALHYGKKGSIIANKDGITKIPPVKPRKIRNTTGAGDTFNAAYLKGYLLGWSEEKRGFFANEIAAKYIETGKI